MRILRIDKWRCIKKETISPNLTLFSFFYPFVFLLNYFPNFSQFLIPILCTYLLYINIHYILCMYLCIYILKIVFHLNTLLNNNISAKNISNFNPLYKNCAQTLWYLNQPFEIPIYKFWNSLAKHYNQFSQNLGASSNFYCLLGSSILIL